MQSTSPSRLLCSPCRPYAGAHLAVPMRVLTQNYVTQMRGGGGFVATGATVTMVGGAMTHCSAGTGGGVYVVRSNHLTSRPKLNLRAQDKGGTLSVSSASFKRCGARSNGGKVTGKAQVRVRVEVVDVPRPGHHSGGTSGRKQVFADSAALYFEIRYVYKFAQFRTISYA